MEINSKIAKILDPIVDCKYAIDNPKEGYDCLNSLMMFYEEMGVDMPHQFEDWDLDTYGKRAVLNPDEAHKTFERFVQTLGEEVNPAYMKRGDLLLFKVKDLGTYAGINLGNGHAFIMFDKGGRVSPLSIFKDYIVSVRRLIK